MRLKVIAFFLLTALTVYGTTPELGKSKLRNLVKLPTISFQSSWTFDPERGFILGSSEQDASFRIATVQKELTGDSSDAERYARIGELYLGINQTTKAHAAWARAASLYRKRVELNPEDGILLAGFGHALAEADKKEEAESFLRKAVRVAPSEWKCWITLGRFLDAEARHDIFDGSAPAAKTSDGTASGSLTPAEVSQAQKRMDEAGLCFDKAVAAAHDESEVYFRRGMHHCLRNMMQNEIRIASGEQKEEVDLLNDCFTPEGLADLQHASRLSPRDYRLIANAALFEIYSTCAKKGQVNWREFTWDSLPDRSQRSLREAIAHLQNLADSPEPQLAAGALEVLGILQGPVLRQTRTALADLRRTVALDPSRDQAWELMAATLAQSEHYDELLSVCEDRVHRKDSARNHILLAKAYEKLKRWDDSEEEIQLGLRQSPDDFTLNLALGALLLKRSQDDSSLLSDADGWLARSQELLKKMPFEQRTHAQIVDLTLTRSIYFALSDEVETARLWVKSVLDQDKDNKLALEILSAMDY